MVNKSRLHKPTRLILILLNINFLIFSFVLIIFGLSETEKVSGLLTGVVDTGTATSSLLLLVPSPPTIILFLGIVTIVLTGYGLHGVDDYCHLVSYSVVISVFSLVDLGLGISAGFMEQSAGRMVGDGMMVTLKRAALNGSISATRTSSLDLATLNWARIQRDMKCCGVYGHTDWDTGAVVVSPPSVGVIPGSCFVQGGEDSSSTSIVVEEDFSNDRDKKWIYPEEHVNIFQEGCLSKVVERLGYARVERIGIILGIGKLVAGLSAGLVAYIVRDEWNKVRFV
ncbi:CD82 antigen [Folsomia candida]|uniref:CD82 antigen n=2 Tax=Folsomia candida TaxID=158441 RepID=A0A226EET8_FOLCA|nr:CD82 antigen [Folsomia candida]